MTSEQLARPKMSSPLRLATITNLATYILALIATLAAFRLMIVLTSTETVGLWALVYGLATTIVAAEMGVGSNLVRFIASQPSVSRRLLLRLTAMAAMICLLPATLLSMAAAWPIYHFAVTRPDLPITGLDVALMTALGLSSMIVNAACMILAGLAEGIGGVRQRGVSMLVFNLVTLGMLWPAVTYFKAPGIGVAYLAGYTCQFVLLLIVLCSAARKLHRTGNEPGVLDLTRELFDSTVKTLGSTLLSKSLEPVTRVYIGISGSLTMQAWFELAFRVTNQLRSLAMSALQPLLFIGSSDQGPLIERFERPRQFAVKMAAFLLAAISCASPILSLVLLGSVEQDVILHILILGLGSSAFIIGLPGYYAMMARGHFGQVFWIAAKTAAINAALGASVILGGGSYGPTIALSIALAYSGIECVRYYARLGGRTAISQFSGFWSGCALALGAGIALAFAAGRFSPIEVVGLACAGGLLLVPWAWGIGSPLLRATR